MAVIFVLKATVSAATIAVVGLVETGDCLLALAFVPALGTLWYATRLRARRRARECVRP